MTPPESRDAAGAGPPGGAYPMSVAANPFPRGAISMSVDDPGMDAESVARPAGAARPASWGARGDGRRPDLPPPPSAMDRLLVQVRRVATADITVLLDG